MRMDEEKENMFAPGTEPLSNEKQRLAADLELVARRCQALQESMQQQLFHTSLAGNRRDEAGGVRRLGERRVPERAAPGRRQLADRRLPLEERLSMFGDQMMQLVEYNIALTDQRRRL